MVLNSSTSSSLTYGRQQASGQESLSSASQFSPTRSEMLATTSHHLHLQGQHPQRSAFGIQQLLGLGNGSPSRQPSSRPSPANDLIQHSATVAHLPHPPPPHSSSGMMGGFSSRSPGHMSGQGLMTSSAGHCFPGSDSSRLAYLNSAALMSSMHGGGGNAAAAAGVSMSMFHSFPGDSFARNDVCSGEEAAELVRVERIDGGSLPFLAD